MDDALASIWDAPVAPKSPLFYAGSDDENDRMPDAPPRAPAAEVERAFNNVDELPDDPRPPALTPHQILSSSPAHHLDADPDVKKPKKKAMRLDEGRLIGESGFPQLIKDTKQLKIKGKGHEASDLNRLLQVYQFWTHRLYPKTPFKDTVDRVEKLCHTKRMHNNLSTWRDQAHGLVNGHKADEEGDADVTDLTDKSLLPPDSDHAEYASSSTPAATRPPTSDEGESEFNEVDFDADLAAMDATAKTNAQQMRQMQAMSDKDEDAVIQDAENSLSASNGRPDASAASASRLHTPGPPGEEDDEAVWALVDQVVNASNTTAAANPPRNQDDEDDWNMLDEMDEDMYMDGS
ncbi:replication fork protection component Swi3-domain-containing protein [Mycena filopes]|nr:replication fork protection component Swi3-domain-containing protein [Mycena filopes]